MDIIEYLVRVSACMLILLIGLAIISHLRHRRK